MASEDKVILGIDPGTTIMGFGLILAGKKQPELIELGVLDLRKTGDHFHKLERIFRFTVSLIDKYHPNELSIEAPFYGKNVQSMLKLGRAQGAAISAALSKGLPVFEYAPRKIKQSITGVGGASKEQVAGILQHMMNIHTMPENLDATDGLAAAVCHFYQRNALTEGKSYSSWKDFLNQHPSRLK